MSPLTAAAILAAGYTFGRYRPWRRLGGWAEWQVRHGDWWMQTKPRQATILAALLVTDPTRVIRAHRARHEPEPEPVELNVAFFGGHSAGASAGSTRTPDGRRDDR